MSEALHGFAGAALISLLAACATVSPRGAGTDGAAPSPGTVPSGGTTRAAGAAPSSTAGAAPDASFDWHALVLLPFGAPLTDSPRALHEVLLFHEAAEGTAGENAECYSVDAPPRFVDAKPCEYLLCFAHDRLNRIEARVALPAAAAAETFARACAVWGSSAVPTAGGDGLCGGTDGGIAFSARLERGSGESPATLSMALSPVTAGGSLGS